MFLSLLATISLLTVSANSSWIERYWRFYRAVQDFWVSLFLRRLGFLRPNFLPQRCRQVFSRAFQPFDMLHDPVDYFMIHSTGWRAVHYTSRAHGLRAACCCCPHQSCRHVFLTPFSSCRHVFGSRFLAFASFDPFCSLLHTFCMIFTIPIKSSQKHKSWWKYTIIYKIIN